MKRIIPILAAMAATALIAPLASASDLTINIEGIKDARGTIMLGLFDQASYTGTGAVDGANLVVVGDTVSVTFDGLEPGEYAVRLYHDVNDDGEMNTNPFGMPVEPYAFSNDARGRFGPAKWDAAKFTVSAEGGTHTITMQ